MIITIITIITMITIITIINITFSDLLNPLSLRASSPRPRSRLASDAARITTSLPSVHNAPRCALCLSAPRPTTCPANAGGWRRLLSPETGSPNASGSTRLICNRVAFYLSCVLLLLHASIDLPVIRFAQKIISILTLWISEGLTRA